MSRFDVTAWFCRAIALIGIIQALLSLLGCIFAFFASSGQYWGNVVFFGVTLAAYGFVWLFAEGFATELSGENRASDTKISRDNLSRLLVQCVGFWLLLIGFISTSQTGTSFLYQRYYTPSIVSSYAYIMFQPLATGLLEAVIGFFMAFGPRLLRFIRS